MTQVPFLPKIPYGTRDFLAGSACRKRALEAEIAELFLRWGYKEVVTPTFEYLDIFDSSTLSGQAFKFFDREGNVLVLRPDMTSPIARLASTRMKELTLPKRIGYIANVFRYEQAQAGRQCEFYQAGVELLGSELPSADAEIIALAVETVKAAGIKDFRISLGHVDFLNGIIESTGLGDTEKEKIRQLISRRDLADLKIYLDKIDIDAKAEKVLCEVLFLHGGHDMLGKARALCTSKLSEKALKNLNEIFAMLEKYGVTANIDFDLGLIRNLSYYTGMVFEGYTSGMGFPICGGGRYDNMMETFGDEMPAIGFSLGIDRVLLLRERTESTENEKPIYLAWAKGNFDKAANFAKELREKGHTVELALLPQTESEAKGSAGERLLKYV